MTVRTFLYVPGDRPERIEKAFATNADVVIVDLEDSVAPVSKAEARQNLGRLGGRGYSRRLEVRVNGHDEPAWREDVAAAVAAGCSSIRLPKVEDASWVSDISELLDELEVQRGQPAGSVFLTCTLESARGVLSAGVIASASTRVRRFALGEQDLRRDLSLGEASGAIETAASLIVLHSAAARLDPPVAPVYTHLGDAEGLRETTIRYRDLGFGSRSCIHPEQLDVVCAVYDERPDERSEEIVQVFEAALREGRGTARLADGSFVDRAIYERARQVRDVDA